MRKITLCADDYGLSPAVSAAIRLLLTQKRLNATSVMVGSPELAQEAALLMAVSSDFQTSDFQIGLHLTLTRCFEKGPKKRPSISRLMAISFLRLHNKAALKHEIETQLTLFVQAFGRLPDFIDGHQHCHLLPQVSDILLEILRTHKFKGWLRQTAGVNGRAAGQGVKAKLIAFLSRRFVRLARGFAMNASFSGAYHFVAGQDYASLFPSFLTADLIMCHPGRVDAQLKVRDTLLEERENELAYFLSDAFLEDVKAAHVVL